MRKAGGGETLLKIVSYEEWLDLLRKGETGLSRSEATPLAMVWGVGFLNSYKAFRKGILFFLCLGK